METAPWSISRTDTNAFRLEFDVQSGQPVRVLLLSDEHFDNVLCNRELLQKHLAEADKLNAPTLHVGDTFCAMQGKWDKRADPNQLRPELRGSNYLDRLVSEAAKFYGPYSQQFALIMRGNHEASIIKRHETDLCQRLAERMKSLGAPAESSGIVAFVRIALKSKGKVLTRDICLHHGYGGGGEVTRGMIDNNRTRGQYLADIYFSGHIHRRNEDENCPLYLSQAGTVEKREQFFLRGAAYTSDENSEWQQGRGGAARPNGGWWVEFTLFRSGGRDRIEVNPMRAR